jgi:quercetin dioxygenase-like cupin family protein
MKVRKIVVSLAIVASGFILFESLEAQQTATFKRIPLQKHDLSAEGREGVQVIAELPSTVATGRHTDPGEEMGYVLEGTIQFEAEGKPPVTLKAGDVFFVEAGRVHEAKNVGQGAAKVLATYVVEKGKPLASPAK